MKLVAILVISLQLHAATIGSAKFCIRNRYGDLECYYQDRVSCEKEAVLRGQRYSCVRNPT